MKAYFFDIDGTLVSFKTHGIPRSTIEALHRIKEQNNLVIIATGRPKSIINNLLHRAKTSPSVMPFSLKASTRT